MKPPQYVDHLFQKDIKPLFKSALAGDAQSQFEIALVLMTLLPKSEQRAHNALGWLKNAANQNHVGAMMELGAICSNGGGVEVDLKKAFYWVSKAASLGKAEAQFHLARMYENGFGVERNHGRARELMESLVK